MKKAVAMILLASALLAGCGDSNASQVVYDTAKNILETEITEDGRFSIEESNVLGNNSNAYVILDSETGKRYLYVRGGYGGGLTELDEESVEE